MSEEIKYRINSLNTEFLGEIINENQYSGQENIVINDVVFDFRDNFWDLTSLCIPGKNKRSFKFNFNDITAEYRIISKLYVLYSIHITSIYDTSIYSDLHIIRRFCEICAHTDVNNIEEIDIHIINSYFCDIGHLNYRTIVKHKSSLKKFLTFVQAYHNITYDNEIFDYLNDMDQAKLKRIVENNKRKLLPSPFVIRLSNHIYDKLITDGLDYEDRVYYSILYILIQTGIRPSEAMILEKNCIEEKVIDETKQLYYFTYRSTKNNSSGYQYCQSKGNKNLYVIIDRLKNYCTDNNLFSITPNYLKLSSTLKSICLNNLNEFELINSNNAAMFDSNNKCSSLLSKSKIKQMNLSPDDNISLPLLSQFRVYFASEMRARGINDILISKMLNHKDEKMFGYYVRNPNAIQEDIKFSEDTVSMIIEDNYKILGPKANDYMDKINDFIEKGNVKANYSIDDIKNDVLNNMPIRKKYGGFCIKSAVGRPCEFDHLTNEFYCAYGMCPNQCHMFYHLDYYYNQFREGVTAYLHNKSLEYERMVEKELYKIQYNINHRIIPEIEELEKMINKIGITEILEKHSSLDYVIKNLDEIKTEIEIWKNMKVL